MAQSSSLVLLPARHTAQAAHPTAKTKKTSGDASFAPKLAQAKLTTAAKAVVKAPVAKAVVAAPKPVTAKPVTAKPVVAKPVVKSEEAEGESASAEHEGKQAATPEEQVAADTAAAKTPVPSGAKQAALAQTVVPVEKKPVKLVKTVAKNPATNSTPTNLVNTAAKPVDPNSEGPADDGDAENDTVTIGSGFYGSTKIVARGGGGDAGDEQAQAAGGEAANAAAEAAGTATASTDPQATIAAQIATPAPVAATTVAPAPSTSTTTALNALTAASTQTATITGKAAVATSPQASFNEVNHPTIVSSITGQLLPKGGSMSIRLDPPELGALQVTVHMKDGAMTASFQTSNEDATKLLSRSLGQLKSGLEAAGMTVDKLHVEQAPAKDFQQSSDGESKQAPQEQQQQAQQEQQRRELMQRMLRKIAGGGDPLDLVA